MQKDIWQWARSFALVFLAGTTACSGGWALVSVTDLPPATTLGETLTLTFDVLRLGNDEWPLRGLTPTVEATIQTPARGVASSLGRKSTWSLASIVTWFRGSTAETYNDQETPRVSVAAVPRSKPGRYSATLTLPKTGDWTISIHTGFGSRTATLLPITVTDSDDPESGAISLVERGTHLFVAKGCVACHRHQDIGQPMIRHPKTRFVREDYPVSYLRAVLTDPESVLDPQFRIGMPNLDLSTEEVEALVAFIKE